MSEQDRFYICDLGTSEEGTLLDGFALNDQWVGPLKTGSILTVGPLRIEIQLSDMAKDTPPEGCLALNQLPGFPRDPFDGGLPFQRSCVRKESMNVHLASSLLSLTVFGGTLELQELAGRVNLTKDF